MTRMKMNEGWTWIAAAIDVALSVGLAQLLVHFGWRYSYLLERPLDASDSVVAYTLVLGVILPPLVLLLLIVASSCREGVQNSRALRIILGSGGDTSKE